jgi:hypothetical protein
MLESASDAFGNRRIIDEHDVPVILRRFLVTYLKKSSEPMSSQASRARAST